MRDEHGRFVKRAKAALARSKPATFDLLSQLPDKEVKDKEEFLEMKEVSTDSSVSTVSVDVVPTKANHAQQSARRSRSMSATITVIGNLTADPELRTTNSNKSVINFSLAYTPRKPDGSDGNTSFYNVTAWEYLADNFAASFKKGDRLVVIGRVSQDKWTDKDSEKVMSRLVITAEEIGGTCRFHTVEMNRVQKAKVAENVESEAPAEGESEDIFA